MDAAPADQLRLLDLQELDSQLDRLAARRDALPELVEIQQLGARLRELADELTRAEDEHRRLALAQRRLEDEVDLVRGRAARDQKRLDAGQVSSPRELENLQSEIASLGRRQASLEDELLEVMETVEAAEQRVSELTAAREAAEQQRAAAAARRDEAWTQIDADVQRLRGERDALAQTLPADLITLYESVRKASGGVGAARLFRRRCEGCHLELSGSDLADVASAPPERVLRCEECRRILVRTPDSGL